MSTVKQHIERALAVHGTQSCLAREVGCSQQYISWLLRDPRARISAEKSIAFEKATGGTVSRHDLRPDIFGPAPERAA